MTRSNVCSECGAELPGSAPGGLCPACLLKRGLETNTAGYTDAGAPAARWMPPAVEELAGRFPELQITRLIGRGGMGAVYQAWQKNLDRVVALKILPPEMAHDPAFAERFAREAQAMARLYHPHIVTIHEFGERGGWYYFLMEYVDGVSLRGLLDSGHISPKEALAIVPQICEALQYAHDQGIVHRDIKPENILLSKQGQVKIADFGLAKLMGRATTGAAATEKVMGTPQYMAPEQMNRPSEVDHRADIYSLGVVFYQMLTGELPSGKFAPPSQKVLIDVRLDEVVLRALEREPERRYQQASEVKTQVETIATTPSLRRAGPLPTLSAGMQARIDPGALAQARQSVRLPAIWLRITAIVNLVSIVVIAAVLLVRWFQRQPFEISGLKSWGFSDGLAVGLVFACTLLNLFVLIASFWMMQLRNYGCAVAASILAFFLTPGNVLGLPIGIWALRVLSRREVKEGFGIAGDVPLRHRIGRVLLWIGRILGTIWVLLLVLFAIGEGIPWFFSQPVHVQWEFWALLLIVGGFVAGWFSATAAARVVLLGWLVFHAAEGRFHSILPLDLAAVIGTIYLISSWLLAPPNRWRAFGSVFGAACVNLAVLLLWIGLPANHSASAQFTTWNQLEINDLQGDGTIGLQVTSDIINRTDSPWTTFQFVNSDFVDVERISDAHGRAIPFTMVHNVADHNDRYTLSLPQAVPPGQVFTMILQGTEDTLIQPTGEPGVFEYHMNHWPNAEGNTRRMEVHHLPPGAQLLDKSPGDLMESEVDGRIELRIDRIIPPNGNLDIRYRYRLASAATDPNIATLPCGTTIELVAVSDHPSHSNWWRPDGSPSHMEPFKNNGFGEVFADEKYMVRFFAIKLNHLPTDMSNIICEFDPLNDGFMDMDGGKIGVQKEDGTLAGRQLFEGIHRIAARIPRKTQTVTMRVGIAYDPWQTTAACDIHGKVFVRRDYHDLNRPDSFGPAAEQNGTTIITAHFSFKETDADVRVVAITADRIVEPNPLGHSRIKIEGAPAENSADAYFDDLPVSQVKEFQFQIRPYHWVSFHNVSVEPTTSQVPNNASAATQGAAPIAVTAARAYVGDINNYIECQGQVGPAAPATQPTPGEPTPMTLYFMVPEDESMPLIKGFRAGKSFPVTVLDNGHGQVFARGTVTRLGDAFDAASATLMCTAIVRPEPEVILLTNQTVSARILIDTRHGATIVPPKAINSDPRWYVYLIQPDQTLVRRAVTTGYRETDKVEIKTALSPGDLVVIDHGGRLFEGAKVQYHVPSSATKLFHLSIGDIASAWHTWSQVDINDLMSTHSLRTRESPHITWNQTDICDIQADGTLHFQNTSDTGNLTSSTWTTFQFINSDFVEIEKITDASGQPIPFTTRHDTANHIYRYTLTLSQPVPPGQVFTYTMHGTAGKLDQVPGQPGVFEFYMNHWPSINGDTRRIEVHRLPAGAQVLEKSPSDLVESEKDGRIELRIDRMIPPKGNLEIHYRYRLAAAATQPK